MYFVRLCRKPNSTLIDYGKTLGSKVPEIILRVSWHRRSLNLWAINFGGEESDVEREWNFLFISEASSNLFFTDPLPFFSGAAAKFYIVLEVTNLSKKNFTLLSSDHYPSQGFTINPGMVAKIKKAVSRPSAVIFNARDDSDAHEALYLNGQDGISVTPTKSPLQDVKVTITKKG